MVDSTLQNYEMLRSMCPEVKALIDSDRMSMTVALGKRARAPSSSGRRAASEPLPFDLQRLILAHLVDAFDAADGTAKVKLVGPKVMSVSKALRDKRDRRQAAAPRRGRRRDAGGAAPEQASPPTRRWARPTPGRDAGKKARSESIVDVASFREHTSLRHRRPGAPGRRRRRDHESSFVAKSDRLSLVKALGLVFTGAEPIRPSTRGRTWRDRRRLAARQGGEEAPAATAEPSEEMLILDWISAATEAAAISAPTSQNVTVETDSHGRKPTQAQADAANAKIAEWKTAFAADQSATSLDTFIMERIVAGQRTAAWRVHNSDAATARTTAAHPGGRFR